LKAKERVRTKPNTSPNGAENRRNPAQGQILRDGAGAGYYGFHGGPPGDVRGAGHLR